MPLAPRFLSAALVLALAACGGGTDLSSVAAPPASGRSAGSCGVAAAGDVLAGTVTRVHDGDTLTLGTAAGEVDVRLQGIDAPELAQPFGPASREALAALLLGAAVRVGTAEADEYGRVLGQVFTANCESANLAQLDRGMAWFYEAYRCELPVARREQFARAQQQARQARTGLWAQARPQAPWVFRNGHDPEPPACD